MSSCKTQRSVDAYARLPDFIGVGPPRTATTWLHQVLSGHVGLPAGVKETNFFGWQYFHGLEWYQGLFRHCRPELPMGEFSPNYFADREASERIAEHIPDCRIICTLRDPVKRLFSNYRKMCEQAYFVGSFERWLAGRPDLVAWSCYSVHIARWQKTFGTANRLILLQEDLRVDPQTVINTVCRFLGIEEIQLENRALESHIVNAVRNMPRSYRLALAARAVKDWLERHSCYEVIRVLKRPHIRRFLFEGGPTFPEQAAATESHLRTLFRPDVEALEQILKRDLSEWKWPSSGASREKAP